MIIQCDKCGAKYNVDDAKVRPGETKVRCSQCQFVFTIPHPLTLNEEEIFGATEQKAEDEFIKEWAKEFTPHTPSEPRRPAPPAPDEGPPPKAFVPPTNELPKEFTPKPPPEPRRPAPEAGLPPKAFVPPDSEAALFAEEPSPEEEVLPFKISPVNEALTKKERKVSSTFVLTMLLLLIVTGALYYWSKMGRSVFAFEYIYEKIYTFMEGKKDQKLFLLYLKGSEYTLEGGKVFVIQGKVANRSQQDKKIVKLKGSLFDKTGKVVATSTGFCGITIMDEEVKNSAYNSLKSSFGFLAVGQARPVPSQQSSPFTIIFFSPPEGASQYQIEIVEAAETG
jgi:predicted Zn finger-like uncharacterized protein